MKPTGTISNVNKLEVMRPPMTIVANGGQISNSRPVAIASGHRPATVVAMVNNTGRVRSRTAAYAAAPGLHPAPKTNCCIRSTSRIAGLTVRPIRATAPTIAMGPSATPANTMAQVAPSKVIGNDRSTNTGSVSDSNVIANTKNNRRMTGKMTC